MVSRNGEIGDICVMSTTNGTFNSSFLPSGGLVSGGGGVINIWPVKPFETVSVIKCYKNEIELNYLVECVECFE